MNSATASAKQDAINLLDFDRKGLQAFFAELGEKPFRATQLLKWIYQEGVTDFDEMTNLSKVLRSYLKDNCDIKPPKMVAEQLASDGTCKWAVEMHCGNRVETVYIPEEKRATLCVSSQIGCALACSFCSTAQQGFNRNLSVAEIIGQLYMAQQRLGPDRRITNVVMMGMGEPLLNYEPTVTALKLMLDDNAYGLSRRRVTLSTSGVVPMIDKLSQDCPVALAVSLHASNDVLRDSLIPLNKKHPLRELMAACKRYLEFAPRDFVTFEYCMLDGVNDTDAHARELVALVQGGGRAAVPCKFNLIP